MIVTVLLGNNLDELSQYRWSNFVREMGAEIASKADAVHFVGFSPGDRSTRSACWLFEASPHFCGQLKPELARIAGDYGEFISWIQAPDSEFLGPNKGDASA